VGTQVAPPRLLTPEANPGADAGVGALLVVGARPTRHGLVGKKPQMLAAAEKHTQGTPHRSNQGATQACHQSQVTSHKSGWWGRSRRCWLQQRSTPKAHHTAATKGATQACHKSQVTSHRVGLVGRSRRCWLKQRRAPQPRHTAPQQPKENLRRVTCHKSQVTSHKSGWWERSRRCWLQQSRTLQQPREQLMHAHASRYVTSQKPHA